MFEATVREGVLRVDREGTRWLSTGWNGGHWQSSTAYNVSVPEGFERTDLDAYVADRRERAGFETEGPALLTAIDFEHVRGARCGPVEVYATAGLSNPAALPMDPSPSDDGGTATGVGVGTADDGPPEFGTVNLVVGTRRSLEEAALANLLAVAVEAKAATLLAETGYPGTTSDAVVLGCDPTGESAAFTGSSTPVGAAARASVREAVRASLASRYPDGDAPATVADAEYGVSTDRRAEVFRV